MYYNRLIMDIPWYFEKKNRKESFNTCKSIGAALDKKAKDKSMTKSDIINQALAKELGVNNQK